MLNSIEIRDFQSLRDIKLDVGKLTVLIGPSSSGKSAVLRAMRAVTANLTSPSIAVSHGASKTTVVAQFSDGRVRLIRGPARSEYQLGLEEGKEPERYPKSGTSVPEDVARFLRVAQVEGEDLNFALQFDRPFLLDVPATTVSKVLGDLTGIDRIYAAVREANRRRLERNSRLKVRRGDLEWARTEAQEYVSLPAQQHAVAKARELWSGAQKAAQEAEGIEANLKVFDLAAEALAAVEAEPALPAVDVPALGEQVETIQELVRLIRRFDRSGEDADAARIELGDLTREVASLDAAYHAKLKEAGRCPVCDQTIS